MVDAVEDDPSPAISVCVPCRNAKRKCDGCAPCSRCVARGEVDDCVKPSPKRRGRPPKRGRASVSSPYRSARRQLHSNSALAVVSVVGDVLAASLEAPPQLTVVARRSLSGHSDDDDVEGAHDGSSEIDFPFCRVRDHQAVTQLVSLGACQFPNLHQLCVALAMPLHHSPGLSLAMGSRMRPNYMVFEIPQLCGADGQYDVMASIMASRVVAAGADGTLPRWCSDTSATYYLGKTKRDMMVLAPQGERTRLYARLSAQSVARQPIVRSVTIGRSTLQYNDAGRSVSLKLCITICVNAYGQIEWIYTGVEGAEYVAPPAVVTPPPPLPLSFVSPRDGVVQISEWSSPSSASSSSSSSPLPSPLPSRPPSPWHAQ